MSKRVVTSTEMGTILCRIINVDPNRVRWLRLTLAVGDVPLIELEMYAEGEDIDTVKTDIGKNTKRYTLLELVE